MQERDIREIRKGIYGTFREYQELKVSISQLQFGTTDEHIFDLIGESLAKQKVKAGRFWEINVNEVNAFALSEQNILYGGLVTEHEVFTVEKNKMSKEEYNQEYADAIEELQDLAREYNRSMELQDSCGFYRRAYVTFEKHGDGVPNIKLITIEHVYYEESVYASNPMKEARNIDDLETISDYRECEVDDIYNMACLRWQNYDIPEHLTMVYVKADVFYTPYGEKEMVLHLDKIYDGFDDFVLEINHFHDALVKNNLEKRWQEQAGLNIDAMNELAGMLSFENYLKSGLKEMNDALLQFVGKDIYENMISFLNRQTSLEDYLNILITLLNRTNPQDIRAAYQYMKENPDRSPKEVFEKFFKPHLEDGYVKGNVYIAEVYKEHAKIKDLGDCSVVKLFDDKAYCEIRKRFLAKRNFSCMIWQEEDYKVSTDKAQTAYLTDNVHEVEGRTYIHAWEGEFLPVKVVGYTEDGIPITEFAIGWRHAT